MFVGQYCDNLLCTLCAPIFSRNISRKRPHIRFSIIFSYPPRFPPLRLSMFPAAGAGHPKLFQVYLAFLLYGPALRSPFCFHRRVTSCRTSMHLALFDPRFLFMHRREHSQSQYIKFPVCMQITSWRIFLHFLAPPARYFSVNLPSFLSLRQYLLPAEFQPTLSRRWPKEKGVSRKRKLFRQWNHGWKCFSRVL